MEDIVRRAIKRELPCKLTDVEMLRIARERVAKEAEVAKLKAEAKLDAERRKAQVVDLEEEIAKKGAELHTEHQDRIVLCDEFFRKDLEGGGWIHTIRRDTGEEVERRPATAHEAQRHMPGMEPPPNTGLLDQALAAQAEERPRRKRGAKAEAEEPSDIPGESVDG